MSEVYSPCLHHRQDLDKSVYFTVRLFADKMMGGAVYHLKFVGRLVGMLVNLLARMVSILWGPCQGTRLAQHRLH